MAEQVLHANGQVITVCSNLDGSGWLRVETRGRKLLHETRWPTLDECGPRLAAPVPKPPDPWVIEHERYARIGRRYATIYERDSGRNDGLKGANVGRIYKLSAHCWELRWGGPLICVETFERLGHVDDFIRDHWTEIREGRKSR